MNSRAWTLLAAGDVCVRGRTQASPLVSESVRELISSADIALCNLEGAIAQQDKPIAKVGAYLALDHAVCAALAAAGFDGVALANNHTMDFGWSALQRTMRACDVAGLARTGAGADHTSALSPCLLEVNGTHLGVMAVAEHEFGIADDSQPGTAWVAHPDTLTAVRRAAAEVDVLIVFSHGGVEEVPLPPVERQAQLRSLVDAGAKVVIGTHPHIIQGWERYREAAIFYSLGDFVFDYREVADRKSGFGALARIEFEGSRIAGVAIIPTRFEEGQPTELLTETERLEIVAAVDELNSITADPYLFRTTWDALVTQLWAERYGPWLEYGSRFRARTRLRPRVRKQTELLLLNLQRCESHAWTIARALSLQAERPSAQHGLDARISEITATLMDS
jgi:poly-gamma-glutamate synthesis protein (capsule biosynthesis protein)